MITGLSKLAINYKKLENRSIEQKLLFLKS